MPDESAIEWGTDSAVGDEQTRHWSAEEVASFMCHPGVGRVLLVRTGAREATPMEASLRNAGYRVGRLAITRETGHLPQAAATFMPDVVYVQMSDPTDACLEALEALASDPRTQPIPMVTLVPEDVKSALIDDAYTRSGCDFFRAGGTDVELLARTHLLVRLARRGPAEAEGLGAPQPEVANSPVGGRLDLRDPSTGVYSATYFVHRLPSEIARARRYGRELSLLAIHCPQARLRPATAVQVAAMLSRHVRAVDLVARVEPDLFALLLPETPADRTEPLRARIEAELQQMELDFGIGVAGLDVAGDTGAHDGSGLLRVAARDAQVR